MLCAESQTLSSPFVADGVTEPSGNAPCRRWRRPLPFSGACPTRPKACSIYAGQLVKFQDGGRLVGAAPRLSH